MTHDEIDRMPAGPEMDRLVAVKVCGCNVVDHECCCPGSRHVGGSPSDWKPWIKCYSTDLNAAVEACGERDVDIRRLDIAFWFAAVSEDSTSPEFSASAPTPSLALCRALLKSLSEP